MGAFLSAFLLRRISVARDVEMLHLADWPIRRKLSLLTTCGALVALLLACLAFAVHDARRIRAAEAQQLDALADILGSNATAAIEFSQSDVAAEVLSSLHLQPSVELAALYDADGQTVATYRSDSSAAEPIPNSPAPTTDTVSTNRGYLTLTQEISRDGERIGTIYLRSNLDEINRQLAQTGRIVIVVMIAALVISMLITRWLQRLFTTPIQELVDAMRYIAEGGDYSLHVKKHGCDEFGILCDGFNTMLDQIEVANDNLRHAHDGLEKRVTERTAELRVALQAAEAASRAKSDFLANMSHEIRTPMTAILGYTDILADEEHLSDAGREQVAAIRRNGNHLLTIINDILDLSKIEAGKMTVEKIECSPDRLVAEVASLMRCRCLDKGLTFELVCDGPIPETIRTDPTRLRQILVNLIGNAVKFTDQGGIQLAVSLPQPVDGAEPQLAFEIIDTGVGMSPEQLNQVFKAFTQADETMTRRFGGTGLGLAISQALTELLGGELSAQSELDQGSTFRFTVEIGSLDRVRMIEDWQEVVKKLPDETIEGKLKNFDRLSARVLLCEDGLDNQRVIAFLLQSRGADVTVADNGQIGLDRVHHAQQSGEPFDVILMDMQMPVLDGYAATRRLREEGYEGPIVALTAHAMAHDRQKCLDAGCDDYASKPIDRATLLATVARYVADPSQVV